MDERGGSERETPAGATVEEPTPQPPGRRQLRRRASHRLVAGVAGGLADYSGTRPLVYRLGFVLFTVLGGIGLLIYLLLWWVVPREDLPDSAAERLVRRLPNAPSWAGIALLALGAIFLAGEFGLWDTNVLWAFVLIGLGVVLFRRDAERAIGAKTASATVTEDAPMAPSPQPAPWVGPPLPPRPPREGSPLGWLVLGAALLVVGVVAILENLGAVHLRLVRFPALGLFVLGAGLLVGAFVGRARWLILAGLLLVPLVLAASLIRVPLEGGIGDVYVRPTSVGQVHGAYRVIAGSIFVNLTALQGERAEFVVTASSGFGHVQLLVPFDAHVVASGATGYGRVQLGPYAVNGFQVSLHRVLEPKLGDGPMIVVDFETGIGSVDVYREGPTKKQKRELRNQ